MATKTDSSLDAIAATSIDARDPRDPATSDTLHIGTNKMPVDPKRPSAPQVGSGAAPEGEAARGDTIGRFVILGVLGQGGMGLVYSAYDPHLDRKVAIKLLRSGAVPGTPADARARLLREAQAMAKINHRNVITVHEVGTFRDQVYVAMEFADDGTLRDWLKAPRQRREILEKFIHAGRGLAAAHAAGLVHRDFKPDNVLLAKDGSVRVTDFGIVGVADEPPKRPGTRPETKRDRDDTPPSAKVHRSLSGSTPLSQQLTRTGAIMGTPIYMAPEQFRGLVATPRADQFSFCIALYEALYGERPFAGHTYEELEYNVLVGQVAPPPKGSDVPGWIRKVLVRGLSAVPEERWSSIAELLAALERDPAQRTKRVVAWAAGVAAIAGVGLALALVQSTSAECGGGGERLGKIWNPSRRAAIERAFTAAGRPYGASSFTKAAAALDAWGRSWEAGYVDACQDTHVRREQSERLLDLRMRCLDRRLDDARATIDLLAAGGAQAVDRSLNAVMDLAPVTGCADIAALTAAVPPPDDPKVRELVLAVRRQLDGVRGLRRLGRYAEGLAAARVAQVAADATGYRAVQGEALQLVGQLQVDTGDAGGATTPLRQAMHAAAAAGDETGLVQAATWLIYAYALRSENKELAFELAELARAVAAHARPPPETMVQLDNVIGLTYATHGKPDEARKVYEQALALAEKELGPDHAATSTTLNQLGNLAKSQGRYPEARKMLERVLATRERLVGKDHPDVANALNNLGNVARTESKYDEAKQMYDRALAIRIAALGPEHPEVGTSYNNLGTLASELEDNTKALEYYEKARVLWEKAYGPEHPDVSMALVNIGAAYESKNEYGKAREAYDRARTLLEKAHGPDHPQVAVVLSNIGVIAKQQKKYDEALKLFRRAEEIAIKVYGEDHPDVADYLANEATVLKAQDKLDDAERVTAKSLAVVEKAYGADHPRLAMGLVNLGNLQLARDLFGRALESFQKALGIFEKRLPKEHPYIAYAAAGVGGSLLSLQRAREAVPYLERAVKIREASEAPKHLIAEARLYLAQALNKDPKTRKRSIAEAKQAIAAYAAVKDAEGVAEVKDWLKKAKK